MTGHFYAVRRSWWREAYATARAHVRWWRMRGSIR